MPSLELEALRLSLSNMHTAQLELTQANLQKEKETALTELRAMLNGRHAQELALLRSRQQQELELAREQHAREREETVLRCSQETGAEARPGDRCGGAGLVCEALALLPVLGRQAGDPISGTSHPDLSARSRVPCVQGIVLLRGRGSVNPALGGSAVPLPSVRFSSGLVFVFEVVSCDVLMCWKFPCCLFDGTMSVAELY